MPKLTPIVPRTDIQTAEQAAVLRSLITDLKFVSFDTETTSEDPWAAKPLIVSMSVPKASWNPAWGDPAVFGSGFDLGAGSRFVFEVANSDVTPVLVPVLAADGIDVLAHNWAYDAHVIHRFWSLLPGQGGRVFDTMVMDYLFNENRDHGLKDCCGDYELVPGMLPFHKMFPKPPKAVSDLRPELSPAEWALETNKDALLDYAALDPYATLVLFEYLRDKLMGQRWTDDAAQKESTLWDYYLKYEEPFLRATWQMETNGVLVDPSRLAPYAPKIEARMAEIEAEYARMAGRVINLDSNKQLTAFLYEDCGLPVVKQTKGGKTGNKSPSCDNDALEELAESGYRDIVAPLREYRKISKLLSTYVLGLQEHIRADGRVHGSFRVTGVVTGRLSSAAPNLQNIANKNDEDDRVNEYDIRKAFIAPPGCKLVVADFSTLEVVITAQISQDKNLIKALREGLDLHAYTASVMFGLPYTDIIEAKNAANPTKEQKALKNRRKAAKTLMFGILYGMGAFSLAHKLDVEEDIAQDYIDRFFSTYPGISASKTYSNQFCMTNGFVLTLLNRRRRIPEIWSNRRGVQNRAIRQLYNARIQGSAGDLMRFYMPAITNSERLRSFGAKLVLQIHDEVVVETPERHAEETKAIVDRALAESLGHIKWVVPISADGKIVDTWSEGK